MPQKCLVIDCSTPSISNGLCDKHRKRLERKGSTEAGRPSDWGKRDKHPLYSAWSNLLRHHKHCVCDAWTENFWTFVADVPPRPKGSRAARKDTNASWCGLNFYWKEPQLRSDDDKRKAVEWQKKFRDANPDYHKNIFMRRAYGVTIDWYNQKHEEQGGKCAICRQEETAVIRGKKISLAVDHCHETGQVRGLLCRACNNAIGALHHNVNILQSAIAYLHQTAIATGD